MKNKLTFLFSIVFFLSTQAQKWTSYMPNNNVSAIAIDKQGNKWFGTFNGVSKFDGKNWTTYDTTNSKLINNSVEAIVVDAQGIKWFGTVKGVSRFDDKNWTSYTNNSLSSGVDVIVIDAKGNMYFGTNGSGLIKFDGTTWTNYNKANSGLLHNQVNAIAIDSLGNKWIGTNDKRLLKFDGTNWTSYNTPYSNPNFAINSIAVDMKGNIWFGTFGGGVNKFDGNTCTNYWTNNSGLVHDYVNAIAIDAQGNKWFGTGVIGDSNGGVSEFDGDTTWITYTKSNGLKSNYVYAIDIDSLGNKWFGNYFGGGVSELQDITNSFSVSSNAISISANEASTATFDITSNIIWNVSSSQSWLKASPVSGSNNAKITLTASANLTSSPRIAILTVSGISIKSKTIIITQALAGTGIRELSDSDIQLYPVPVIDKLSISFSKLFSQTNLAIYSLSGIQLYFSKIDKSTTEVDMSKFTSGFYFVKIVAKDNSIITKKIIKASH